MENSKGKSMKSVLVCGGEGFLGSHVCELFVSKGWRVISYDNRTKHELLRTGYNVESAREYNKAYLTKLGVTLQKADIRDIDTLREAAKKCDYIVNCAAQPAMTIALENPIFDCDNNIVGTLNILQAARELKIPCALCSTIHVYGNGINEEIEEKSDRFYRNPVAINESHPILTGQITPLHVSKHATELYARAFIESYDIHAAVFRLTGIFGERAFGGEDHSWLCNFCVREIFSMPINIFGTDKQVRDMLYVKDAAQAFYEWYQNGQLSGTFNICGGIENIVSLRSTLEIISQMTGKTPKLQMKPKRTGDLWYFVGDYSKATAGFGWKPKVSVNEGIRRLTDWIKENEILFQNKES